MFELRFLGKALENLRKIDRAHQKIIKANIIILAENPEALKNYIRRIAGADEPLYRLRVGSYRVIFKKDEEEFVILIIRIGHRRDIYLAVNGPQPNYGNELYP